MSHVSLLCLIWFKMLHFRLLWADCDMFAHFVFNTIFKVFMISLVSFALFLFEMLQFVF